MIKRFLLTAVLFICAATLMAQTVDFTGVTINTETVKTKRIYDSRHFFIGSAGVFFTPVRTVGFAGGLRYGWVKLFGLYGGAELSLQGHPFVGYSSDQNYYPGKGSGYVDDENKEVTLTGAHQVKYFTLSGGLLVRLGSIFNLSVGPWIAEYDSRDYTSDGRVLVKCNEDRADMGRAFIFGGELGGYWHIKHLTIMATFGVGTESGADAKGPATPFNFRLGAGYNF